MRASDTTDTLTVLKLLAQGRPPAFIAQATGTAIGYVQGIADSHGWPDPDRVQAAVEHLVREASVPRIPVRAPEHHPQTSRPALRPATSTPPAPSPAPGGTSNGAPAGNGLFTVGELVRAAGRSEHKRTQALGVKLSDLAEKITAALRAERDSAEAKAKQAEEFTAKKAHVDRLKKQLADAQAALRELKPSGVTEAALDFACDVCADVFSTSSGRARHVTRKHKTKEQPA